MFTRSFYACSSQKHKKKTVKSSVLFALLGSAGVNFINLKRANFMYECLFSSYVLDLNELLYEKRTQKTLMKLSPGVKVVHKTLVKSTQGLRIAFAFLLWGPSPINAKKTKFLNWSQRVLKKYKAKNIILHTYLTKRWLGK